MSVHLVLLTWFQRDVEHPEVVVLVHQPVDRSRDVDRVLAVHALQRVFLPLHHDEVQRRLANVLDRVHVDPVLQRHGPGTYITVLLAPLELEPHLVAGEYEVRARRMAVHLVRLTGLVSDVQDAHVVIIDHGPEVVRGHTDRVTTGARKRLRVGLGRAPGASSQDTNTEDTEDQNARNPKLHVSGSPSATAETQRRRLLE